MHLLLESADDVLLRVAAENCKIDHAFRPPAALRQSKQAPRIAKRRAGVRRGGARKKGSVSPILATPRERPLAAPPAVTRDELDRRLRPKQVNRSHLAGANSGQPGTCKSQDRHQDGNGKIDEHRGRTDTRQKIP